MNLQEPSVNSTVYTRGHNEETADMASLQGGRFLLWIEERKDPEASGSVQSREKRKQTRHGQGYIR